LQVIFVSTTDLRPRLTEILGKVEYGLEQATIQRHGKPVAAIVSIKDLHRIWELEDEEHGGPRDPVTGMRKGAIVWAADVVKGIFR